MLLYSIETKMKHVWCFVDGGFLGCVVPQVASSVSQEHVASFRMVMEVKVTGFSEVFAATDTATWCNFSEENALQKGIFFLALKCRVCDITYIHLLTPK
jgi:hypothetical protein